MKRAPVIPKHTVTPLRLKKMNRLHPLPLSWIP
ncbi:Uncharacterised protein [Citrobacter freundii]|nr:Uncharacterised protein [Citrobacter freundii]